jgi:hypothetical protein
MLDKKESKEKTRKIYDVLPKLDDKRWGHRTCGEFARAVVEGKAPCYGCVSGGPQVAARVCEIMGVKIPEEASPQPAAGRRFYQPGFLGGRGMGVGMVRGYGQVMGRGRGWGMARGRGMGRGGWARRGFGRGWRGG